VPAGIAVRRFLSKCPAKGVRRKTMNKTDRIVEQLLERGFNMTKEEYQRTRLYKVLERFDIEEKLTIEEYLLLSGKLFLICD
jgi:hypothetical protein